MPVKKSTKKFIKKNLAGEIKRRRQQKEKAKTFQKKKPVEQDPIVESESSDEEDMDMLDVAEQHSESESDSESEDESCSEQEDEDEKETKMQKKQRLQRQVDQHKQQLLEIKEKDPEFYNYLEQNDKKLLEFGQEEEEEEEEGVLVTRQMVQNWKSLISEKRSMRACRQLLSAFKAAVIAAESEDETSRYRIEDVAVFNLVVVAVIKYIPSAFDDYLEYKKQPSTSPKWKKISSLVKGFLKNTLQLLEQLSDKTILGFIFKHVTQTSVYFMCFPKLAKQLLKASVQVWSDCGSDEKVRIQAFLVIRKLADNQLESCLKMCYLAFQSTSKNYTVHTSASIQFMITSLTELFGLKSSSSYNLGFVYIRQLAILLRTAIVGNTKESIKKVMNWQFVNCCRFWGNVLCNYCDIQTGVESVMKQLLYPFVQVMIGAIGLKPSSKYFFYRFHCIRILNQICAKTATFVPLGSYLFDVLDSNDVKLKPKPSTLKPMELEYLLKVPTAYLRTASYQGQLIQETANLMFEYYVGFAMHIGFPELAIPATSQLKKCLKSSKNAQFSRHFAPLVEKLQENSDWIIKERNTVDFCPKDTEKVASFLSSVDPATLPLIKYALKRNKQH